MPLVRISVGKTRTPQQVSVIGKGVYQALLSIGVPNDDNFQIITKHEEADLVYGPHYLGIDRTSGFLVIQIFLNAGRTLELKKQLYAEIAKNLSASGEIRPEDIFINLVEVAKENWSFGNGFAQYA